MCVIIIHQDTMKYASFDIKEVEQVNNFLEKNSDKIAADGVKYEAGRVCFLYSDIDEAGLEDMSAISSAKAFIGQRISELLGADVDERYWRGLGLKGVNTGKNVVDTADRKLNIAAQIRYAHDIIDEIRAKTWGGNAKIGLDTLGK